MTALPTINALVRIEVREGTYSASRVEDVQDGIYTIATPHYSGDLEAPQPGEKVNLVWVAERGLFAVPAEFLGAGLDRVRVWRLAVAGDVTVKQRRRFVRVPITGDAEVSWPGTTAKAEVIDLSEGGLRFATKADVPITDVTVTLPAQEGAEELTISARVLRAYPVERVVDVVAVFNEDDPLTEQVRRRVVAEQLRRRRAERDAA